MHNHSVSLLAAALLALAVFSTTWPHSASAEDGVFKAAPQPASEADIEENVLDASPLNDPNDAAIAPPEKGGPTTRQAAGCRIVVDNWTLWKIEIYIDGVYQGTVSSFGEASGRFQGNTFVVYGVARFLGEEIISWGPDRLSCAGMDRITWQLFQN